MIKLSEEFCVKPSPLSGNAVIYHIKCSTAQRPYSGLVRKVNSLLLDTGSYFVNKGGCNKCGKSLPQEIFDKVKFIYAKVK